ncbi:PREDICTED: serotransferrin, partial [Galeopterus variegatus]|uniref:Serotransferrin n=1 Tax=Galeopterus variegatus TaxID=482537 RepID=A0ABM0R129_GALVR
CGHFCVGPGLPHTSRSVGHIPPVRAPGSKPSGVAGSTFFLSPGANPDAWAKNLQEQDFELLCPDGTRKPVADAQNCYLARGPNHAVVSREDKAACVKKVLHNQQVEYGRSVTDCSRKFCLFQSETKDLLFRDDTVCLAKLPDKTTYEKYLGAEYVEAVGNLKKCSTSRLLEACTFHKV